MEEMQTFPIQEHKLFSTVLSCVGRTQANIQAFVMADLVAASPR